MCIREGTPTGLDGASAERAWCARHDTAHTAEQHEQLDRVADEPRQPWHYAATSAVAFFSAVHDSVPTRSTRYHTRVSYAMHALQVRTTKYRTPYYSW